MVITRSNDRRLHTLRGAWVRNGDRWRVTEVNKDGSMRVHRPGVGMGGEVTLPASYVAEHVDLGYVVTAHCAQGINVDTAHVVVFGTTTRENPLRLDDPRRRRDRDDRRRDRLTEALGALDLTLTADDPPAIEAAVPADAAAGTRDAAFQVSILDSERSQALGACTGGNGVATTGTNKADT